MKRLVLTLFSLLALTSVAAQSYAVGINTVGGWSDSPFISRDGQRLYFMYSRYNFGPWIKSGGTATLIASGPDRPGLNKSSNPFDESDIYVATRNADGTWSEPINLGLNGAYGDSSGMELNGGNTFVWLQGNGSTNNIVMTNKDASGQWGPAVDLGSNINDHHPGVWQDNPHMSPDGKGLWFVSNRAGGAKGKDIWFSLNSGSGWSVPVNAGPVLNDSGDQDQPWFSPVGPDAYWNGPLGIMHAKWNGGGWTTPTVVRIPGCVYAAEVSMPDDGKTMFFACADATTFVVKIMYSIKQPNGSWGTATPVD